MARAFPVENWHHLIWFCIVALLGFFRGFLWQKDDFMTPLLGLSLAAEMFGLWWMRYQPFTHWWGGLPSSEEYQKLAYHEFNLWSQFMFLFELAALISSLVSVSHQPIGKGNWYLYGIGTFFWVWGLISCLLVSIRECIVISYHAMKDYYYPLRMTENPQDYLMGDPLNYDSQKSVYCVECHQRSGIVQLLKADSQLEPFESDQMARYLHPGCIETYLLTGRGSEDVAKERRWHKERLIRSMILLTYLITGFWSLGQIMKWDQSWGLVYITYAVIGNFYLSVCVTQACCVPDYLGSNYVDYDPEWKKYYVGFSYATCGDSEAQKGTCAKCLNWNLRCCISSSWFGTRKGLVFWGVWAHHLGMIAGNLGIIIGGFLGYSHLERFFWFWVLGFVPIILLIMRLLLTWLLMLGQCFCLAIPRGLCPVEKKTPEESEDEAGNEAENETDPENPPPIPPRVAGNGTDSENPLPIPPRVTDTGEHLTPEQKAKPGIWGGGSRRFRAALTAGYYPPPPSAYPTEAHSQPTPFPAPVAPEEIPQV